VPGVIAADLKLDTFSEFVQAQRPGQHGTVLIFDQAGSLIAHPEFSDLVTSAMTHPARSSLPSIDEINTGIVASVIRGSYNKDSHEGNIEDETGKGFLFRVTKFALGERYTGNIVMLAAQDDFVQNVRRLQFNGSFSRSSLARPFFRSSGCSAVGCRAHCKALQHTGAPIADTG
jgi:adenylate cyclase